MPSKTTPLCRSHLYIRHADGIHNTPESLLYFPVLETVNRRVTYACQPAKRSRELRRYDAGAFEYFAPSSSLLAVELFLFAWVEGRRYQARIFCVLRTCHDFTVPMHGALLVQRLTQQS